jgi:signal transduction histidine kinase
MCQAEVLFDFGEEQRDIILRATPVKFEAEDPIYLGQLKDVTERRRLDRRKDEFLSIASHELRSPLTPLTGVLQLARRQLERGEEVDVSLLTRAERQIARLTRLIDGLLDLTRIETDRINLSVEPIDFGRFIEEQIRPWRLNPKDVELEVETPEDLLEVEVDPDRINQVLTNVVDNAIKYSKPTGVIRIELADGGERVCLAIEDEGVGMDEETVDRIFDRFFHGPTSQGGTTSMGLGLYICRQIVEQHNGDITVESTKGVGTRIEIELPKSHGSPSADGS